MFLNQTIDICLLNNSEWDEDGGFPSDLLELTNLEDLKLANQAFRVLPSGIGNLKKLVSLDLGHCYQLASLPEALGQIPSLKGIWNLVAFLNLTSNWWTIDE